jgi:8-hydroxy-5-deazaflavin:NADPH oxidoreductase
VLANIRVMNIGIIGSGKIGATAARLFVDAGHNVAIANSRGPDSLTGLVQDLGESARPATVEDAAASAELVLVAIPFGRYGELPAEALGNRIVVDAMNYYPERDGHFPELDDDTTTSTELLAAHVPDARVVKAFNSMRWTDLGERASRGPLVERLVLFVAGDDQEAKERVSALIEEIGFAPVDTGSLAEGGRRQQVGSSVYTKPLVPNEARDLLTQPR